MRHQKRGRKLGRTASHRKAVLSNLAAALIQNRRIKTTDAKAKEARSFIEPLITKARRGTLHDRREVLKKLRHPEAVKILFDEIAPHYKERPGGYTRIVKLGFRDNDSAPVSLLEFVDLTERKTASPKEGSEKSRQSKKSTKKTETARKENSTEESD